MASSFVWSEPAILFSHRSAVFPSKSRDFRWPWRHFRVRSRDFLFRWRHFRSSDFPSHCARDPTWSAVSPHPRLLWQPLDQSEAPSSRPIRSHLSCQVGVPYYSCGWRANSLTHVALVGKKYVNWLWDLLSNSIPEVYSSWLCALDQFNNGRLEPAALESSPTACSRRSDSGARNENYWERRKTRRDWAKRPLSCLFSFFFSSFERHHLNTWKRPALQFVFKGAEMGRARLLKILKTPDHCTKTSEYFWRVLARKLAGWLAGNVGWASSEEQLCFFPLTVKYPVPRDFSFSCLPRRYIF